MKVQTRVLQPGGDFRSCNCLHELKVRCLDTPGQVRMMCDGDTEAFIYAQETELCYSL